MSDTNNPKGSVWHRWDPHIHIPGTILNDQYNGPDPLGDFINRIDESDPPIRVLGVTEYYLLDSYEKIVAAKHLGKLTKVELIFPNIELRFGIGTSKNKAINAHLLVSPEDPNHVKEVKRFLSGLTHSTGLETYKCTREDLIKLGYDHDKNISHEHLALATGVNQFKIDHKQLLDAYKASVWATNNILIGISVATHDGTSGLNNDDSFSSVRQTIERMAHIIFSSSEKQRKFWLGESDNTSKKEIESVFGACKPCIHGSDSHKNEDVGNPDRNLFTWIKGDLTFESLRQACIEPGGRVLVGPSPPNNQIGSNIISKINFLNADFIYPTELEINNGLVAVIGARGSGKTALADIIAAGGHAIAAQISKTSFIKRAFDHLTNAFVTIHWEAGNATTQEVQRALYLDSDNYPRVQYLSQQFVDQLCSSEGMTDQLLSEIERVIYQAHDVDEILSSSNFQDLLTQKAAGPRATRSEFEQAVQSSSEAISKERAKRAGIVGLEKIKGDLEREISTDKTVRAKLISYTKDQRLTYLDRLTEALDHVTGKLEQAQNRQRSLNGLKQTVSNTRTNTFPTLHAKIKENHPFTGFSDTDWQAFQVEFKGHVDSILNDKIGQSNIEVANIKGVKSVVPVTQDKNISLIPSNVELKSQTFELLTEEIVRVKSLIGVDIENGKQYARLSEKIVKAEGELQKIKNNLIDANGASGRMSALNQKRGNDYQTVFQAILDEETILKDMYLPLMNNLDSKVGTLNKLKFVVKRQADIETWALQGEDLLDLRKAGTFKGHGALLEYAITELKQPWENGNAAEIAAAIATFRTNHEQEILDQSPVDRNQTDDYIRWANKIAGWLYGTSHITITYGIVYDGVDIQQLSPGTRGIILLLLYLAIDKDDDRPLIIDQPEENLDPKSIFDELVPLFTKVKSRRQIIIVTHNANLVVNTDAEQVIIAKAGTHLPGKLPPIEYYSGGLENPLIRKEVCEILEGGAEAFKERAKRLRVSI